MRTILASGFVRRPLNFDDHERQDHGYVKEDEDDHPHPQVASGRTVGRAITAFAAEEAITVAQEIKGYAERRDQPEGEEDSQRQHGIGMRPCANDFAEDH